DAGRTARALALHAPYHEAVGRALDAAGTPRQAPVLVAVHSFTPRLHGSERPWHIGVLWDKDPRLPLRLLAALRVRRDVVVGDNEPYSGRHPADFTIDHHAEPRGIAHVGIEIRQDMIRDPEGQARWAGIVGDALAGVLGDPALYRPAAPAEGAGAARRGAAPPGPGPHGGAEAAAAAPAAARSAGQT